MKIELSYMFSRVLRGDRYLAKTRLNYMTSKISRGARYLAEIRLSRLTSRSCVEIGIRGDEPHGCSISRGRIELQETLFSLPMVFFPIGFCLRVWVFIEALDCRFKGLESFIFFLSRSFEEQKHDFLKRFCFFFISRSC